MAADPNSPESAHPLFNGKTSVGMISGENPKFPAQASGHQALGEALKQQGVKAEEREGMYGAPEKSWMVYGPTREQMYNLGKQFGQESVVYSQNGRHELLYTNGPKAGKFHPALDHQFFQHAPEDYYTNMPELGGFLRLNFDWDQLNPTGLTQDAAVQALHDRAAAQQNVQPPQQADREVTKAEIAQQLGAALRKALAQIAPKPAEHPLAYAWHNEHTDHHPQVMSPGVIVKKQTLAKAQVAHPHMDGSKPPMANEQASTVGTSTYGKFALPYGAVDKTKPTDLTHYPYAGKNQEINNLVKDHGYSSYYAGGKYGRPDLANRNYNTKHLMIYDPSPGSGGDFGHEAYTDGWRKIHELAHALTYPELNEKYGEGRRIGKLGVHRTLREGLRAVHWEWLAAHKQRELGEKIGVHIPDHVFHKELNTVMHDAIHRAVTGKFTEPSGEGFAPHEHKLPLEHALGMVRESAHNLGVTGMHDLIKKNEGNTTMADDKVLEAKDWRAALAKGLRDRVDSYSKQMLELRSRELKKNLAADPALAAPAPALKPVDLCPLCSREDVPGKCMCLQGPAAGMPAPAPAPLAQSELAAKAEDCVTPPAPEQQVNKSDEPPPHPHGKQETEPCSSCKKPVAVLSTGKLAAHTCAVSKAAPLEVGQGVGSMGKKEFSTETKAKEPVKGHKEGGNGVQIKAIKKALGDPAPNAGSAAGMPKPKLPGMAAPVAAAKPKFGMADLTAGKAKLQGAGVKPISPLGAPKLPGMGAPAAAKPALPGAAPAAAPKPAAPAGVGHLAAPPKPALPAAPKPAGAPPAAGAAPKPALPKPAAPAAPKPAMAGAMGKSEIKKSLGNCALCAKPEHTGSCS